MLNYGRNDYEERRQERIDRLNERAEKAQNESNTLYTTATRMGEIIPFGQPVHGERDRAYREKIADKMDKAIATSKKADYYADRAQAAENNKAISSDNPNSVELLQAKIDKLRAENEEGKAMNKHWRKFGTMKGYKDFTDEKAERLDNSINNAWFYKVPCPPYVLQNNNSEIKRLTDRIEKLKATAEMPDIEIEYSTFILASDSEINRITFEFAGIPAEEVRTILKHNGYKWTPSIGKWGKLRSPSAWNYAKHIATEIEEIMNK